MDSERLREYQACLALHHTPGVGARTWKKILRFFHTVQGAVADPREWGRLGAARAAQVLAFRGGQWQEPTARETRMAQMRGMNVLLWSDPDYPETLRQIPNPPLYLYYLGDPILLAGPGLAVVGSRQCSRYGLDAAKSISRDVSRAGICIETGFVAGIARQAHMAAVDEIGASIAVLGTGLDLFYPARNKDLWLRLRDKGLIITEFPPGTKPVARNFTPTQPDHQRPGFGRAGHRGRRAQRQPDHGLRGAWTRPGSFRPARAGAHGDLFRVSSSDPVWRDPGAVHPGYPQGTSAPTGCRDGCEQSLN